MTSDPACWSAECQLPSAESKNNLVDLSGRATAAHNANKEAQAAAENLRQE